jgi:hypothetical protein
LFDQFLSLPPLLLSLYLGILHLPELFQIVDLLQFLYSFLLDIFSSLEVLLIQLLHLELIIVVMTLFVQTSLVTDVLLPRFEVFQLFLSYFALLQEL